MSKNPVVVYGATGFTGRLVAEYLRDYGIAFTAAGRDGSRVEDVMSRIPGVETAKYDVAEVEHTVASLSEAFEGSQVVLNMVGPFADYGAETTEAALNAGCHYLDTNGEQNWMLACEADFAERFAEAGLLLAPGVAQMYTLGEIAAQFALETPGLDTLDILVLWGGRPTTASTETIFTNLLSTPYRLMDNELVPIEGVRGYDVAVPGQHETALTLPWGGTSHPVWFKQDARVAHVKALGGVFDRTIMEGVVQISQMVEEQIRPLPEAEQAPALAKQAEAMRAEMPPREAARINRTLDSVHASGPNGSSHVVLRGNQNYKQTALLEVHGAHVLTRGKPAVTGFASACQAFGHRELHGILRAYGLVGEPQITITKG